MPNSLFNQDVTSWPMAHDSGAIVAEFNHDWQTNYGSVGVNTRPVVWVPGHWIGRVWVAAHWA